MRQVEPFFSGPLAILLAIVALLCPLLNGVSGQSMPIAINGDGPGGGYPPPNGFGRPGPPPMQPQGISPISAILGNIFGGLGSLTGFASNGQTPSNGAPLYGGPPMGPAGLVDGGIRDHRPQSQIECSVTSIPPGMGNGFAGHFSKSIKNSEYSNQIESSLSGSSGSSPTNRTGICVPSPFECKVRHGNVLGPCFGRRGHGLPRMPIGVCCNFEASCGQVISMNGSHFKSPKFPNPYSEPGSCAVSVKNTYNNICQIRLDFDVFNLKQPINGNCNSDRFVVSGQPNNIVIPSICGYNPGQHIYIDVDETNRDSFQQPSPPTLLTLNVITSGMRHRWFDIRVSYIHCDSEFRAPSNCLQYFTAMVGQVKSFNYDLFNQGFTYFNNLDYTICFKKWPGFCTVTYEVPSSAEEWEESGDGNSGFLLPDRLPDEDGDGLPDYDELLKKGPPISATTSKSAAGNGKSKKKIPSQLLRPHREVTSFHIVSREHGAQSQTSGAAGPLKCNTDYLVLNNLRFCGHHLNEDSLYSSTIRSDAPVMDNSTGPIYARFVTSVDTVGKGFVLNYQLNPCLMAGR